MVSHPKYVDHVRARNVHSLTPTLECQSPIPDAGLLMRIVAGKYFFESPLSPRNLIRYQTIYLFIYCF